MNIQQDFNVESVVLKADYEKGLFKDFKPYATSFGMELAAIEDAILFNNAHEAMHLGTMLAIRKFL